MVIDLTEKIDASDLASALLHYVLQTNHVELNSGVATTIRFGNQT